MLTPWSRLSEQRKAFLTRQFEQSGATSVNGVAGWYHQQRFSRTWQRPKPNERVSRFRLLGEITAPDEAPEPIALDELKDLF